MTAQTETFRSLVDRLRTWMAAGGASAPRSAWAGTRRGRRRAISTGRGGGLQLGAQLFIFPFYFSLYLLGQLKLDVAIA